MYYSNLPVPKGLNGEYAKVFVAESRDGFLWEKPELDIIDWHGSRRNNLLIASPRTFDAPSVTFDPDEKYPYKLLAFERDAGSAGGLFGYRSRDGLRFERLPGPLLLTGDRTNMMTRKIDGTYVVYTRHKAMMDLTGTRSIYRTVSDDFRNWTEPELVLKPDLLDEPEVEYYGMSVFLRHGWFLGLLEYWRSDVDCIETYLVFSRDGISWKHPEPRRPFIAAQFDWNRTWSSCASNGPVVMNEQMVFYFGGRWVSHHFDFAQQEGVIGYASLPIDRFCALEATTSGLMETKSLTWPGGDLAVNVDTRPFYDSHPSHTRGELSVEVLDGQGKPMTNWSGEDKAHFSGNTVSRCYLDAGIVRWPGNIGLAKLRGQTIRLRFHLNYGRLYTIQAASETAEKKTG